MKRFIFLLLIIPTFIFCQTAPTTKDITFYRGDAIAYEMPYFLVSSADTAYTYRFGVKANLIDTTAYTIYFTSANNRITYDYSGSSRRVTLTLHFEREDTWSKSPGSYYYDIEKLKKSDTTQATTVFTGSFILRGDIVNPFSNTEGVSDTTRNLLFNPDNVQDGEFIKRNGDTWEGDSLLTQSDYNGLIDSLANKASKDTLANFVDADTLGYYYNKDSTNYIIRDSNLVKADTNLSNINATNAKTNLGLNNVDNTSDANKPVSTAQQDSINLTMKKAANLSDVGNKTNAVENLFSGYDQPKLLTAMGDTTMSAGDTAKINISSTYGGKVKEWNLIAPPDAMLLIDVDGTNRYTGKLGNLFMSRANAMLNATFDDVFISKYFSVTQLDSSNIAAGHVAYFDIPFIDSVNIKIISDTTYHLYYDIFYENVRRVISPYNQFYAYTQDSVAADASVNDTLLTLSNVGKGVYYSLYFWALSDSIETNIVTQYSRGYLERDFYCVVDDSTVRLSTGAEDYCGYSYYFRNLSSLMSRTSDYHGVPTFGLRDDSKFLDAFYRIHALDKITFDNNFILYWEKYTNMDSHGRYCHIGYTVIYYLEEAQ